MPQPFQPNPTDYLSLAQHSGALDALYAEGYKALADGKTLDAQLAFARLASLSPQGERAWLGLGASLEQQGNYKRALGVYTLGQTLDPDGFFCRLGQARTLARLERLPESRRLLDQAEATTTDPEHLALIEQMRDEL